MKTKKIKDINTQLTKSSGCSCNIGIATLDGKSLRGRKNSAEQKVEEKLK